LLLSLVVVDILEHDDTGAILAPSGGGDFQVQHPSKRSEIPQKKK
jgi:hypothetical protein